MIRLSQLVASDTARSLREIIRTSRATAGCRSHGHNGTDPNQLAVYICHDGRKAGPDRVACSRRLREQNHHVAGACCCLEPARKPRGQLPARLLAILRHIGFLLLSAKLAAKKPLQRELLPFASEAAYCHRPVLDDNRIPHFHRHVIGGNPANFPPFFCHETCHQSPSSKVSSSSQASRHPAGADQSRIERMFTAC